MTDDPSGVSMAPTNRLVIWVELKGSESRQAHCLLPDHVSAMPRVWPKGWAEELQPQDQEAGGPRFFPPTPL